jgi:hypothetical protein
MNLRCLHMFVVQGSNVFSFTMSQTLEFISGAIVGFVASHGEGSLKRVLGVVVSVEGTEVVLAVPLGSVTSEDCPLPKFTCSEGEFGEEIEFHLIRIPTSEITREILGWKKATQFVQVPSTQGLLRIYYRLENPDKRVPQAATESMFSATSGDEVARLQKEVLELKLAKGKEQSANASKLAAAYPAYRSLWPGAPQNLPSQAPGQMAPDFNLFGDDDESEDEGDPAMRMMRQFAKRATPQLGTVPSAPSGSAALTDQAWTQVNAETPLGLAGAAGSNMGNPSGIPQSFNPLEAMTRTQGNQEQMYQQFTQRFQRAAELPGGGAGPQAFQNMVAGANCMPSNQGTGGVPFPNFGADQQQNMQTLMMMAYMNQMSRQGQDGDMSGHKAFRRVHKLKQRVYTQPEEVVNQYLTELVDRMGIEAGDAWAVWQYTQKLPWGRNQGLMRAHFHASHCLQLSLRGQHRCAQAYLVQLCRALYQVALDRGSWETASLFLPRTDPAQRDMWGGTEQELEAAAAYNEAMKKMRKNHPSEWTAQQDNKDKDPKGKGKGKGKDKDDKGGEDGGLGK